MVQQSAGRHHKAWGAEPALAAVLVQKRPLQFRKFSGRRQPFYRQHTAAGGADGQYLAGVDGLSVQQDGAGAAFAPVATPLGAGEAQRVPQNVQQRPVMPHGQGVFGAVDDESNGGFVVGGVHHNTGILPRRRGDGKPRKGISGVAFRRFAQSICLLPVVGSLLIRNTLRRYYDYRPTAGAFAAGGDGSTFTAARYPAMQATDVETGEREIASLREFAGGPALGKLEWLLSDSRTEPRRALERFDGGPALAELELLLSDSRTEQRQALERFAADDRLAEVKRLLAEAGAQAARFNLFELLGLASDEERHSRILGWLFDPAQNHGIGEAFLTRFLAATTAEAGKHGIDSATVPTAGWETTGVQLEWANQVDGESGYLDILIVNRQKGFLCAIENKIWAAERSDQLTRYRRALEAAYPDYRRHLVFLSPRGTAPYCAEERKFWTPVSYTAVLSALDWTIETQTMPPDVSAFLRQYATTLRMNIVPDSSEINQLARKIYLEHREAIELIYQHKPDFVGEAKRILREAVRYQTNWSLDQEYPLFLQFRPREWADYPSMATGTGLLPSTALLLFQFNFRDGRNNLPYLCLTISTGDDETARQKLFDTAQYLPNVFTPRDAHYHTGWMVIDEKEYILDESDYDRWDDPSVPAKITDWVADFAANRFPAMNEAIVNCLEEYKAEQDGRAEPG